VGKKGQYSIKMDCSTETTYVIRRGLLQSQQQRQRRQQPKSTMAELLPSYGKIGLFVATLKAVIDYGSFIVITSINGTENELAQLINGNADTKEATVITLQTWEEDSSKVKHCRMHNPPAAEQIVAVDRIVDIAFVVGSNTPDVMKDDIIGRCGCYWSSSAAIQTFPCSSPLYLLERSYARSVWEEMERVRRLLRKMMCRQCQHQGEITKARESTYLSHNTFSYFQRLVARLDEEATEQTKTRSYIDYNLHNGLSRSSKRRIVETTQIEIKGNKAMIAAVGQLATIGIRSRRPRLKQGILRLIENDAVHYLEEDNESVSVRFDHADDGRLFIQIRYLTYHFVPNRVDGAAINCNSTLVAKLVARYNARTTNNDEATPSAAVVVGDEIWRNNELWSVATVGDMVCEITTETGRQEHIATSTLQRMFEDYL
jgi:hypothetical protein